MDPYGAAAMGAGVVDGQAHLTIGLHFSSQESAEKNANEIIHRWSTARLKLAMPYTALELDKPFDAYCSRLDDRAVALQDASVQMAACPLSSFNSSRHGEVVPGDGFWATLVEGQELHYLLADPTAAHRWKSEHQSEFCTASHRDHNRPHTRRGSERGQDEHPTRAFRRSKRRRALHVLEREVLVQRIESSAGTPI